MIKPLTILCLLGSFSSALWAAEPVSPQPATPLTYENPAYHKVVPAQAREMMRKGVVVIDVRMPVERLKEGFIKRTPRGREVTDLAYTHLNRHRLSEQGTLF